MNELYEHIYEKELEGVVAVSISVSKEVLAEMERKIWQFNVGVPINEESIKWSGIPVHRAIHLLFGYVINWSDGTSTKVQTENPLLV